MVSKSKDMRGKDEERGRRGNKYFFFWGRAVRNRD